jgi:hypothetical protein
MSWRSLPASRIFITGTPVLRCLAQVHFYEDMKSFQVSSEQLLLCKEIFGE